MKPQKILLFFLISLFFVSTIVALQINSPETIRQDETILIEVTANFVNPILKENILLQKEHVRVSSDFQLILAHDIYYIATPLTGKSPGNYSVVIKDSSYQQGANIIDQDIYINFTILEQQADFSISPGVVFTDENFEVKLQNLQEETITIDLTLFEYYKEGASTSSEGGETVFEALFGGSSSIISEKEVEKTSTSLKSGEIKFIPFKAEDFRNDSLRKIKFASINTAYSLPVFVFLNKSRNDKPIELVTRFDPGADNISMITNSTKTYIFHFFNDGDEEIENITFTVSGSLQHYVNLSLHYLEDLEKNSSITMEVYIISPINELSVDGFISAASGEISLSDSELTFNFIKDYIPPENDNDFDDSADEPDDELGGSIWKILGIILVIVVIGFAVWFYFKKFKKSSLKPDLIKQASPKRATGKSLTRSASNQPPEM